MQTPGEWIQARRAYLKLTRAELALEVACSPDTIKKIETGKRRPSVQIAEQLAKGLKVGDPLATDFVRFVRGDQSVTFQPPDDLNFQAKLAEDSVSESVAELDPIKVLNRLPPQPDQRLFGVIERLNRLEFALVSTSRPWLISIEGIGGIGKTTLAYTLVQRIMQSGRFDDIGWVSAKQEEYVTGRGIRPVYDAPPALDEEALVDSLLAQLADGPYPIDNKFAKRSALHEFLQTKTCLIVIDNLETVSDYEALVPLMRHLARPSKFLITSRMSLQQESDIVSESVSELSKENTLDYLRYLTVERPRHQLQQATQDQLEGIHQIVGGNPLALKLVVGQASVLPLEDVLESVRLSQTADADQLYVYIYRQAWELLSEDGRKLLLALPIVPNGTFKQLVISSQLPPFKLHGALKELQTLSLIEIGQGQEHDEPRYRIHRLTETFLMHEVLNWDEEHREKSTAETLFFEERVVAMVDHWRSSRALSKNEIEELDREKEGMLTAVRLSLSIPNAWEASKALIKALTSYMERRGHWSEWQSILEEGIRAAQGQADTSGEIELMGILGRLLQRQGKEDEVVQNYRKIMALARKNDDQFEFARACSNLGYTLIEQGKYWRSEILCCHALETFLADRDLYWSPLAHTYNHLGILFTRKNEGEKAERNLLTASAVWEKHADKSGQISAAVNLSFLHLSLMEAQKAISWAKKGLELSRVTNNIPMMIKLWVNLAEAYILSDQPLIAFEYAQKAESHARELGFLEALASSWVVFGVVSSSQKKWEEADKFFKSADEGYAKLKRLQPRFELASRQFRINCDYSREAEAQLNLERLERFSLLAPSPQNVNLMSEAKTHYKQLFS